MPSGFAVVALVLGVASVLANVAWNCGTCGWDLDRVPWYQAFLIAVVPLVLSPIGVLIAAGRLLAFRTRKALIESFLATIGFSLPWLWWITRG